MEFSDPQLNFSDFPLWNSLDTQDLPSGYTVEECNGSWPQLGDEWSFQTYFPDLTNEAWISKGVAIENSTPDLVFDVGKPGGEDSLNWDLLTQGDHSKSNEVQNTIRQTVEHCLSDSSFSSANTPSSTYDAMAQFEMPTNTTNHDRTGSKSTHMSATNTVIFPEGQVSKEWHSRKRHALQKQKSPKAHWHTPHDNGTQETLTPRKRRRTNSQELSLDSPLSHTASTTDSSIVSQPETTPIFSPISESPFHFPDPNEEYQGRPENIPHENISESTGQFYNHVPMDLDALDMDTERGEQWNWKHHESHSYSPEAHKTSTYDELTPLEMPDGTIRFTTNWLPVSTGDEFMGGSSPLEMSGVASFRY